MEQSATECQATKRKLIPSLPPFSVADAAIVIDCASTIFPMADAGIPELARMPHALDPETGFRVRSRFTFMDFIEVAQPASPPRWLADAFLGFIGARSVIENEAREFLDKRLEVNSTRVQSDILNRVQESRGNREVEIR